MAFVPMLVVSDVEATSAWLCKVLPLKSAHGGPDFEMLADMAGDVILWLHDANPEHEHAQLEGIDLQNVTGGAILYLQVVDVDAVYQNAKAAGARILEEPRFNPLASFTESTFEDPNGYRFAIHSARAE